MENLTKAKAGYKVIVIFWSRVIGFWKPFLRILGGIRAQTAKPASRCTQQLGRHRHRCQRVWSVKHLQCGGIESIGTSGSTEGVEEE
jgi:hypothetical protein